MPFGGDNHAKILWLPSRRPPRGRRLDAFHPTGACRDAGPLADEPARRVHLSGTSCRVRSGNASDDDLMNYGFPPRPDPLRSPGAHAAWRRLVMGAKTRIMPKLEQTNIRHLPMRRVRDARFASNNLNSYNWRGEVLASSAASFAGSSYYTLWGEFNVPWAQQAFGVCDGVLTIPPLGSGSTDSGAATSCNPARSPMRVAATALRLLHTMPGTNGIRITRP